MTTSLRSSLACLFAFCSALAIGCEQSEAAPEPRSTPPAATATPVKASKVVFVGKSEACDCTKKKIDASFAALERAVGTPPKLPIERLDIDTQEAEVARYESQKPILTLPAIYVLDTDEKVLELLQGEMTESQVAAAIRP